MAKRFLSLLLVVICATLHAMAQLITVKGNVVDKAAEPIIGASVTIAGTTKATVTDFDGNFTMQADANAELTISYIGFKTKKVKVGNGNLKIELEEENTSLDEVVIVGTVMRKSDLTGSVAMVDSKTLEQRPSPMSTKPSRAVCLASLSSPTLILPMTVPSRFVV